MKDRDRETSDRSRGPRDREQKTRASDHKTRDRDRETSVHDHAAKHRSRTLSDRSWKRSDRRRKHRAREQPGSSHKSPPPDARQPGGTVRSVARSSFLTEPPSRTPTRVAEMQCPPRWTRASHRKRHPSARDESDRMPRPNARQPLRAARSGARFGPKGLHLAPHGTALHPPRQLAGLVLGGQGAPQTPPPRHDFTHQPARQPQAKSGLRLNNRARSPNPVQGVLQRP